MVDILKITSSLRKFLNPRQEKEGYGYPNENVGRWKAIFIVMLTIVIILGIYSVNSITGYTVRQGSPWDWLEDMNEELSFLEGKVSDLETQLSEAQNTIDVLTDEKDSCSDELNETEEEALACEGDLLDTETQLSETENQLTECTEERDSTQEDLSMCTVEKGEIAEDLEEERENYDEIVRNSAQSKCCSVSDVITGTIKRWDIVSKDIVCSDSGEYKVDCKTGETDY